jgi:uncharacterized protein YdeI (YjbR/CyaY-like superfamily)
LSSLLVPGPLSAVGRRVDRGQICCSAGRIHDVLSPPPPAAAHNRASRSLVMGKRDPRVDAYIERSADFAKPILTHVRETVHAACPDIEEDMKWSFPHFLHRGIVCSMAAFKQHCAFGFWKGALVLGDDARNADAMGQFGQIKKVSDLPSEKALTAAIRKAVALNDSGVKAPRAVKRPAPGRLAVPADLAAALDKNTKARATFDGFSPSHKREYIDWITGAKRPETRTRRVRAAVDQMQDGKPQNWKYM